jgi:hypothetical protein
VGPCHHSMPHTQVAVGGTDSDMKGSREHIFNKQSRTEKRGGPPAWGLGEVLTTPHLKNVPCKET